MNENIHVDLTPQQRSILLDGLSFLRSAALLETRFPSEENSKDRERQVREIEQLAEQLGGNRPVKAAASV